MTYIGNQNDFKFHSRCKSLKQNHLCFADDLILFSKGDPTPVNMLLKGLKLFSYTSSMYANCEKSVVYCCGMEPGDVDNIVEASGFSLGSLPFRYLGVPVSAKKLNAIDCEKLIEKMIARIKVWSTRHLSFTGVYYSSILC